MPGESLLITGGFLAQDSLRSVLSQKSKLQPLSFRTSAQVKPSHPATGVQSNARQQGSRTWTPRLYWDRVWQELRGPIWQWSSYYSKISNQILLDPHKTCPIQPLPAIYCAVFIHSGEWHGVANSNNVQLISFWALPFTALTAPIFS